MGRKTEPTTAGVACLRQTPLGTQVLLVHARDGRWVVPKGRVEKGESAAGAAAREAAEEAGLVVRIDEQASTDYRHRRANGRRQRVTLFVGDVVAHGRPSQSWRRPTWVPLATLVELAPTERSLRPLVKALGRLGLLEGSLGESTPAEAA